MAWPTLRWQVTNQATVHEWFASHLGQAVAPLRSLEEGMATWPESASRRCTCPPNPREMLRQMLKLPGAMPWALTCDNPAAELLMAQLAA